MGCMGQAVLAHDQHDHRVPHMGLEVVCGAATTANERRFQACTNAVRLSYNAGGELVQL